MFHMQMWLSYKELDLSIVFVYLRWPFIGKELKQAWGKINNRLKMWMAVWSWLAEKCFCAGDNEVIPFVTYFLTLWSCISAYTVPLSHPLNLYSSQVWYLTSSGAELLCPPPSSNIFSSCRCRNSLSVFAVVLPTAQQLGGTDCSAICKLII